VKPSMAPAAAAAAAAAELEMTASSAASLTDASAHFVASAFPSRLYAKHIVACSTF